MSQLDAAREHLSKLQAQVDLTPYQPLADSPSWLNSLANSTSHQLGALALLGPPGINVSTTGGLRLRVLLDSAGLFLAGLSCQVRASGRRLDGAQAVRRRRVESESAWVGTAPDVA
jgi:hypothetical protein